MADALAALGLYRRLVGARIRSQLQYRLSFALNLVGTALISFVDFAAILVIFGRVDALAGWTVAEVGFLYGITSIAFALADLLVGHLDQLPQLIRTGELDVLLVRPVGSLFQVVSSDFALRRLGKVLQALVVLVVALAHLEVEWTVGRVAMLPLMVVTGVAIFCGVWVIVSTVAFWLVDSGEVANAFTYGGGFLTQYPVGVYGGWLRRFVIFVVPLAFVGYFPAAYVLGKDDGLGLPAAVRFAAPVVAVVVAVCASFVWRGAVRRYRSVGS